MLALDGGPILVTGAGGFIGSNLVRALLHRGARVHALLGPPGTSVVGPPDGTPSSFSDICDLVALKRLLREARIVVHLAGPASVARSFDNAIEFSRTHVMGTATLLEACRESAVGRLVHVSSAEIFGQPEANPVAEDDPIQPRSPYAAAKAAGEFLVRSLAPTLSIEAIVLRPFSVYGPGAPARSLLGRVISQAIFEDEVVVFDLRPVRDYCYVDDLVDAIIRSCKTEVSQAVCTYNIGSGSGTSVAQLIDLILKLVGRDLPIRAAGQADRPAQSDILKLISDPSRAEQDLGWRARTLLRRGLARCISSFDSE